MLTILYRGFYIHGYCDKNECSISSKSGMTKLINCRTLAGAKRTITKISKEV